MSTEQRAVPDTGDEFVERLTAYLDRQADRSTAPVEPELARFEGLAGELRAMATWAEQPAELREGILAQVRAPAAEPVPEQAEPVSEEAEPVPEEPAPTHPRRSWRPARWRVRWRPEGWRVRWGRLAWAVPAAALGAAVFTGGVLAVDRALQSDPPPAGVYQATGTELARQATAEISVWDTGSGFSVVVAADGLPAAAEGSYYAAWLRGEQGMVPLGSFHERRTGTPVELWSGVDPDDYSTFVITLQAEGEPPTPSQLVVMTAPLTP